MTPFGDRQEAVREWLIGIRKSVAKTDILRAEAEEARAALELAGFGGESRSPNPGNPTEAGFAALQDSMERLNEELAFSIVRRDEARHAIIESCTDTESVILCERYLTFPAVPFRTIAKELCLSESHVKALHASGMRKTWKRMPKYLKVNTQ